MRPAQHLDPLDVVYVEHRGLRAVQINVVEIDADACLETRHRILLADAADARGERRVGAARRLERADGSGLRDPGAVYPTLLFALCAGAGRDRDRGLEQPAAADPGVADRVPFPPPLRPD